MSDGEEGTPMKSPKSASSVEEAPVTTPFPDMLSSMQAYDGGAAPAALYASTVGSPTPHPYMWRNQDQNLAPTSGEVGRKISNGKGRTSAKKSKGVSGSTSFAVDKGADNQKAASSLSLKNGVDLKVRSTLDVAARGATAVHDGMLPDQGVNDEQERKRLKILKRQESNRQSAKRSRLRKKAECEELQERVDALKNENHNIRKKVQRISEACTKVTSENHSIKEELLRNYGPDDFRRLPRNLREAAERLLIEDGC
ncbi:light-inducible protein CPRF3-like isoform X2 [Apium graveolens]|uniref:light-inducible protein CPRF3-like isoform X2 n=1 Tax=Apium graveolens TaxID=4045 RepID=UPI003D7AAF4A